MSLWHTVTDDDPNQSEQNHSNNVRAFLDQKLQLNTRRWDFDAPSSTRMHSTPQWPAVTLTLNSTVLVTMTSHERLEQSR